MNRKQFRTLIVVLFFLFLAGMLIDSLFPGLVPEKLNTAVQAFTDDYFSRLPYKTLVHVLVYFVFALVGPVIGLLGLFFFRRWARSLYTVIICTMPLTYLFSGISLFSWPAALAGALFDVGIGFALAIAWFSPLKEEFR